MDPVIAVIKRSNQRGGRMLSVVDLIEAGTLTLLQACWLIDRIQQGASFLIGARPGGAGKTTVMGALLAMLPAGETVRLAARDTGWEQSKPGDCIVAYEIGRGPYEAYVWGDTLVQMTDLGRRGCRIVSNLHADTLDQAREQVAVQSGARESGLAAFEVFVPITVSRRGFSVKRTVDGISYYHGGRWMSFEGNGHTPSARERDIAHFVQACLDENRHTIEAVRTAWLAWQEHGSIL